MASSQNLYELPAQHWLKASANGKAVQRRVLREFVGYFLTTYVLCMLGLAVASLTSGYADFGPTRLGGVLLTAGFAYISIHFAVGTIREVRRLRSAGWMPPMGEESTGLEPPNYRRLVRNAAIFLVVVAAVGSLRRLV